MNAIIPRALAHVSVPVIPPHPQQPGSEWLVGFDRRDFLELGAYDFAARTLRGVLRQRLQQWGLGHLLEVAELVATELVTNAVAAIREFTWEGSLPPVRVWLLGSDAGLTIAVWDPIARAPVMRQAAPDDESGRGLEIVAALSAQWDFYLPQRPFSGKVTWAFIQ